MQTFEQAASEGKVELLVNDAHGIHIPRIFVSEHRLTDPDLAEDLSICADPDHEHYWEAWENILDNGTLEGKSGHTWTLHQDGDLWAIRDDANIDWEDMS